MKADSGPIEMDATLDFERTRIANKILTIVNTSEISRTSKNEIREGLRRMSEALRAGSSLAPRR